MKIYLGKKMFIVENGNVNHFFKYKDVKKTDVKGNRLIIIVKNRIITVNKGKDNLERVNDVLRSVTIHNEGPDQQMVYEVAHVTIGKFL